MEKVEFGPIPSCAKAKTITYRYDIKKQSKIIPIPIPIWFKVLFLENKILNHKKAALELN